DHELGRDAVRLAQLEVVLAVIGRHVDEAGAALGGDELARQERPRLGVKPAEVVHRVAGNGAGEVGAFDVAKAAIEYGRVEQEIVEFDNWVLAGPIFRGRKRPNLALNASTELRKQVFRD